MTEMSDDFLYEVLSHHRRRHAIECLREHGPLTVTELADAVAIREYERPIEKNPDKAIKGIRLTLHHAHIPKLEDAEIVVYDRSNDTVLAGETFERAVEMLVTAEDSRWRVA